MPEGFVSAVLRQCCACFIRIRRRVDAEGVAPGVGAPPDTRPALDFERHDVGAGDLGDLRLHGNR